MLYNICYITSNCRLYKQRSFCYVARILLCNKKVCYIAYPNLPDVYVLNSSAPAAAQPFWSVARSQDFHPADSWSRSSGADSESGSARGAAEGSYQNLNRLPTSLRKPLPINLTVLEFSPSDRIPGLSHKSREIFAQLFRES